MDRERISERSVKYLLLAEWPARLCVLLPVILAGLSLGNTVRSIAAGTILWCLVIGFVLRWIRPEQDFFRMLEGRAGRMTALAFCAVSLWYFMAHTAVFARLWAELLRLYLLPFIPEAFLCMLPLAAGLVFLRIGLGFRVRVSKYAGIALLVLAAGLACLAGNEVPLGAYRGETAGVLQSVAEVMRGAAGTVRNTTGMTQTAMNDTAGIDGFARSAYEVFLCLGGLFLPFLSGHLDVRGQGMSGGTDIQNGETEPTNLQNRETETANMPNRETEPANLQNRETEPTNLQSREAEQAGEWDRAACQTPKSGHVWAFRRVGCVCAAVAGAFCVAAAYLLTPQERRAADFPAVEAMRVLRPFGIDAGRLETVLVLLLLVGLTAAVIGGFWYVRKSFDCLGAAGVRFSSPRIWWRAVVLIVYVLAAGFGDAFSAVTFYRAYNMQILVPAMLVLYAAASGIARGRALA